MKRESSLATSPIATINLEFTTLLLVQLLGKDLLRVCTPNFLLYAITRLDYGRSLDF